MFSFKLQNLIENRKIRANEKGKFVNPTENSLKNVNKNTYMAGGSKNGPWI